MHDVYKNVPMPKAARTGPAAHRIYPFEEMDVGDMFFVPHRTKNTLTSRTSTAGKALNRTFVTRMMWMVETDDGWEPCEAKTKGAVRGIGVWRSA